VPADHDGARQTVLPGHVVEGGLSVEQQRRTLIYQLVRKQCETELQALLVGGADSHQPLLMTAFRTALDEFSKVHCRYCSSNGLPDV